MPFGEKVNFFKNKSVRKTKIEAPYRKTKGSNSTFCRVGVGLQADILIKVPTFSFGSH
jgi:hypothetical protein